jgi:hypothetical protein
MQRKVQPEQQQQQHDEVEEDEEHRGALPRTSTMIIIVPEHHSNLATRPHVPGTIIAHHTSAAYTIITLAAAHPVVAYI